MPAIRKIRLLLADDHEMVRSGVKALLAGTEIEVVAEAATGQGAIKLALEKKVDLMLLDVCMPDGDGLTALDRIKLDKPDLPVLLFSAFDNYASIVRAIGLGASGCLLKGCTRKEFLKAIRAVAAGKTIWSRGRLIRAGRSLRTPPVGTLEASLSERESEVLWQIVHGMNNEQLAKAMNISCQTVKQHVKHILQKIGVADRAQAAVWAIRNGLV
ncbi:MAG: response regulator transcription factor [Thermoguttaceae bacterium]|jgi:DNA-binding NarL/FixJ family response regulator